MKRYFSLLLFFLIFGQSRAQVTNFVYWDYSSLWHYYESGWNGIESYQTFTTVYMDGDTTINGQTYYKQYRYAYTLFMSGNSYYQLYGPFAVREAIDGNSYYYFQGSSSDELMQNNINIAAAEVGDSMPVPGGNCDVLSVEYHTLGAQTIKQLKGLNYPQSGIVEGLGYAGPVCAVGVEGNQIMVCYYRQTDSICFTNTFSYEDFPEPLYMSAGNSELNQHDFTLSPNPATDYITIDPMVIGEETAYTVKDALGKVVLKGFLVQKTAIDISSLTHGMYFVTLDNFGNSLSRKFVVRD